MGGWIRRAMLWGVKVMCRTLVSALLAAILGKCSPQASPRLWVQNLPGALCSWICSTLVVFWSLYSTIVAGSLQGPSRNPFLLQMRTKPSKIDFCLSNLLTFEFLPKEDGGIVCSKQHEMLQNACLPFSITNCSPVHLAGKSLPMGHSSCPPTVETSVTFSLFLFPLFISMIANMPGLLAWDSFLPSSPSWSGAIYSYQVHT